MAAVFAAMTAALLVGEFGRRRPALILAGAALLLAIRLFLWEIYSQIYGYRMPWIDL